VHFSFKTVAVVVFVLIGEAGMATAKTVLPDFSAATFVPGTAIDNAYFPLVPGAVRIYEGNALDEDTGEYALERIEITVLPGKRNVAGIQATVVRDRAFIDGVLVEDTFDWFAQDTQRNVWYLGEDTLEYLYDDDGNFIGTAPVGAWETGVNGALPGYLMPADRPIGLKYYQEFAPADDALDEGEVIAVGKSITGPLGDYIDVLQLRDSTALEPGKFEYKYYAPGIGLVRIEADFDEDGNPATVIQLVGVPSPSAALGGALGMLGLIVSRRRPVVANHRI
jgi:hypothetical protein